MTYNRTQYAVDKERGVFRVMGICFENSADDNKIKDVLSEISYMDVVAPAMMTREALCLYVKAPEYVLERMATMPVGSSFEFNGLKITRWSNLTYNGKAIWVGELRLQNPFLGLICQRKGKIIPIGWSFSLL